MKELNCYISSHVCSVNGKPSLANSMTGSNSSDHGSLHCACVIVSLI